MLSAMVFPEGSIVKVIKSTWGGYDPPGHVGVQKVVVGPTEDTDVSDAQVGPKRLELTCLRTQRVWQSLSGRRSAVFLPFTQ